MISTVKKEITMSKELHSKIEWACTFSNCKPKIKNCNLRMVEKNWHCLCRTSYCCYT